MSLDNFRFHEFEGFQGTYVRAEDFAELVNLTEETASIAQEIREQNFDLNLENTLLTVERDLARNAARFLAHQCKELFDKLHGESDAKV